jgi:DNA polymerase I-like protein with 3'-5' exonuclease and polymerase domains
VERGARAGRRRRGREHEQEREVGEGLLLAEYAVRLTVKNQILVDVVGRGEDFDRARAGEQVQAELGTLAREYQEAAERMRHDARIAAWRLGRGRHQHDYRAVDRRNLRRRARAAEEVARRLRAAERDADAVVALVDAARAAAWEDLAGEVHRALRRVEPPPPPPPDLDPEERALRQQMVVALDLTALAEEQGVVLDGI